MSNNNFSYQDDAYSRLINKRTINVEAFSLSSSEELSLLEDLQANILKHHKRNYACHVFIKFKDSDTGRNAVADWVEELASNLTSASLQLEQRRDNDQTKSIVCFYLSKEGYQYFGLPHLAPSKCSAFEDGLIDENRNKDITKGFQVIDEDGIFYKKKKLIKYHAMLLFADNAKERFDEKLNDILGSNSKFSIIEKQYALLNKVEKDNNELEVRDWFGFVDGISGPQFFPNRRYPVAEKQISSLKSIAVRDPAGLYQRSFGSYMVFMKMRQNLASYNSLKSKIEGITKNGQLAEANIMGRFKSSSQPLTLTDGSIKVGSEDFDYKEIYEGENDGKGSRCPFHAHIRKANPRDTTDYQERVIHRRGMSYIEPVENANDLITIPTTNKIIEETATQKEVGLYFISFQASIEKQFEFVVKNWLHQNTNLGNGILVGKDILTSKVNTDNDEKEKFYIPEKWNRSLSENSFVTRENALVELLGGQYFFAPAISSLIRIAMEMRAGEDDKEISMKSKSSKPMVIGKLKRDKKTGAIIIGRDVNIKSNIKFEKIIKEKKSSKA